MRVLVTGHQGFIGSVLTAFLQSAGHEVAGLDAGWFAENILGPAPRDAAARRADVRDLTARDLGSCDAVIHLAGLSNDPLGNLDESLTWQINHEATVRLATAAKTAGIERFLFASSCSLYGAGAAGDLLDEDSPFAPITPYAESKVRSEQALLDLADDGFSPVFLRCATAYGFSPRLRCDLVVNDLTARALLTGKVLLQSDGTAWRPLVHVEDIAAAYAALMTAPRDVVHARSYNVGRTAENYRIREVAELVAELVPGSEVAFGENAGSDARDYRVSCDRIAAEVPGFQPRWTVRAGIEELVNAYRDHGMELGDLEGGKYIRLAAIGSLQRSGALDARLRWTSRRSG